MTHRLVSAARSDVLGFLLLAFGAQWTEAQQDRGKYAEQTRTVETLVRSGQWDAALNLLQPIEKDRPDDLRVLNLKGLALTGAGQRADADSVFARCLAIHPGYFPALKNMGINEFLLHHWSESEAHLAEALAATPGDRSVSLYLGQLAFQHGDWKRSAVLLGQAGDLVTQNAEVTAEFVIAQLEVASPKQPVLYRDRVTVLGLSAPLQFAMGLALLRAGNPSEAVSFLQAAEKAGVGGRDLQFDLILAEVGSGLFNQAITGGEELIAAGGESSELDNLLSEAYEAAHRTQEAVDALRRAIALDQRSEQNYLDFAALCLNHKAYAQGLTVLNVGLQITPHSDRLYFERGILYAAQDQFADAEKDFAKAAELAPDKDSGTLGLGVTYLQSGKIQSAVEVVRQRLRSTPNDAELLCLLGQALLRAGAAPADASYAEAQHALESAIVNDPNLELAHALLGKMYVQQNRDEEAVAELEHAEALKPSDRAVYSQLAVAYRHLHRPDKMQAALTTLRALNARDRGEPATP